MSYYRSYFAKNNTILKDLTTNTAKNPNTEIFYGSGFSKFIFQVDLTDLQDKLTNGDLVLDINTRHNLHLTNTIFGDESLLGKERSTGRERAVAFDLILFTIPEEWDEGVGFDYEYVYDYTTGNLTWDVRPSNWFYRTSISGWTEEGIYSGTPTTLATIHFDNGNENIDVDITSHINDILTGATQNYGLGLAFSTPYELITTLETDQSVSFFTKYTQTFWEPYLETVFDDRIDDNRENFFIESDRNLYLYVNYMGQPYNLDQNPTVVILSYDASTIILSGLTTTHVRKGVYKVTFGLSGYLCDGKRFYYDRWCNLIINGTTIDCITQKFIPKQFTDFFDIGANLTDVNKYAVQFYGVSLNEKIKRGSVRKIVVTFRSINEIKSILLDEAYYRIYVKEGRTQVNVWEWTRLDRTNENSFMLDTSCMIPREYWIEIRAKVNSEDIFYRDEIKFEIISEK
jgi:hypothetical protein